MQARAAFGYVLDAFGWFIDSYRQIVAWSATVERLWVFEQNLKQPSGRAGVTRDPQKLVCRDLVAYHADGTPLFKPVSFSAHSADTVAIVGASGKTTFLRTLSGLWLFSTGSFSLPSGKSLFIPQRPYLPYDTLAQVLIYPGVVQVADARIKTCLEQVGLMHLSSQLMARKLWSNILSGGEQQRLSFARILLLKPKFICLDESTSHLDDKSAISLIRLIQNELPESIILIVSHQVAVTALVTRHQSIEPALGQYPGSDSQLGLLPDKKKPI